MARVKKSAVEEKKVTSKQKAESGNPVFTFNGEKYEVLKGRTSCEACDMYNECVNGIFAGKMAPCFNYMHTLGLNVYLKKR